MLWNNKTNFENKRLIKHASFYTLKEESVCGRKFCGFCGFGPNRKSLFPQNIVTLVNRKSFFPQKFRDNPNGKVSILFLSLNTI